MKRKIAVSQEFIAGKDEIILELSLEEIQILALEIVLLMNALSESLTILSPSRGKISLTLTAPGKKAEVETDPNGMYKFALAKNQGGYLQSVLMKAYRDQMAEVNHIHLEGRTSQGEFDLTVLFKSHMPPMSGEEAAKLLRD